MSVFVLGDPHLSTGVEKPMDVFGGWEHYTEQIVDHWNRLIAKEDTVVLPGVPGSAITSRPYEAAMWAVAIAPPFKADSATKVA